MDIWKIIHFDDPQHRKVTFRTPFWKLLSTTKMIGTFVTVEHFSKSYSRKCSKNSKSKISEISEVIILRIFSQIIFFNNFSIKFELAVLTPIDLMWPQIKINLLKKRLTSDDLLIRYEIKHKFIFRIEIIFKSRFLFTSRTSWILQIITP